MTDFFDHKKTSQKVLSASLNKTDIEFTFQIYKDSNFLIFTIHIYFPWYNAPVLGMEILLLKNVYFIFLVSM